MLLVGQQWYEWRRHEALRLQGQIKWHFLHYICTLSITLFSSEVTKSSGERKHPCPAIRLVARNWNTQLFIWYRNRWRYDGWKLEAEDNIEEDRQECQRKVKVKVKCTFVQALRFCKGRAAHRGSRGIALLYRHWGSVQTVRSIGGGEV